MRILESPQEFNTFKEAAKGDLDIVLVPVFVNQRLHPMSSELAFCYLYRPEVKEGVGIAFGHPELKCHSYNDFAEWEFEGRVWTPDKKSLIPHLPRLNLFDGNAAHYVRAGIPLDNKNDWPDSIQQFFAKYRQTIGPWAYILPLYRLMEYGDRVAQKIWETVSLDMDILDSPEFAFLNETAIPVLSTIEQAGLKLNVERFEKQFPNVSHRFIRPNDLIYSQYNLYGKTGRPSCRFGNVNFAALNKKDGSRSAFISRHKDGQLVSLDFESYHLRLIADELDHPLPTDISAHSYFGQYYFGTTDLTPEQYEESKQKTFALLYGDEETDIPFFIKIRKYQEDLWRWIHEDGYVDAWFGTKRVHLDRMWKPSPAKVFNYLVQFIETGRNLTVALRLTKLYEDFHSNIILYTYDSFLIDYSPEDGMELINRTIEILQEDGKFPIRAEAGLNFNDMSPLLIESNV